MIGVYAAGINKRSTGGGGGGGTVTSVNVSGGGSGLTFTGGPIMTSGTITIAGGILSPGYGGTGQAELTPYSVPFIDVDFTYAENNANFRYNPAGGFRVVGTGTSAAAIEAIASGDTSSNRSLYVANGAENKLMLWRGDGVIQHLGDWKFEPLSSGGGLIFDANSSRFVHFTTDGLPTIINTNGINIQNGWIKTKAPSGGTAGRSLFGSIVNGTFATPNTEQALEFESEEGGLVYLQLVNPV